MKAFPILILTFLVCALVVRLVGASEAFYSPDELMHLSISSGATILEVLERSRHETHPPLEQVFKWFVLDFWKDITSLRALYSIIGLVALLVLSSAVRCAGGANAAAITLGIGAFLPAFVWSSALIRGYGIFLLFISAALREYILLVKAPTLNPTSRLVRMYVWIMLACATHFSGFLFALPLSVATVILLIRLRDLSSLRTVMLCSFILLAEATALNSWYFTPGTGAYEWRELSRSELFSKCSQFQDFDVWLIRLLTMFTPIPLESLSPSMFIVIGSSIVGLYVYSLVRIWRSHPYLILLVALVWLVSLVGNFTGIFPLVGPRHSIYLYLVIIPPFALALEKACESAKRLWGFSAFNKRARQALNNSQFHFSMIIPPLMVVIFVITLAFAAVRSGFYFRQKHDFPLTISDYNAAKSFIMESSKSDDLFLSSRFGLLYALWESDKNKRFYKPNEPILLSPFLDRTIATATATDGSFWQTTTQMISPLLRSARENKPHIANPTVWLLSFGFGDNLMLHLSQCALSKGVPIKEFSKPGIFIAAIEFELLHELIAEQGACLADYHDNLCAKRIEQEG